MNQDRKSTRLRRRTAALLTFGAIAALVALSPLARADRDHDGEYGHKRQHDQYAVALLPLYTQECSSCHIAFPPGMLPAESWRQLLGNLSKHYETDASLDAATAATLSAWLTESAGGNRRVGERPAQDRITHTDWFQRQHREVGAATWKLPAVRSPANCAACHPGADRGDYNEHGIRIPR